MGTNRMSVRVRNCLQEYPLGSQTSKGRLAKVVVMYYNRKNRDMWLITEGEKRHGKWLLYGYFFVGGKWSWGYISHVGFEGEMIERFEVLGRELVADYVK